MFITGKLPNEYEKFSSFKLKISLISHGLQAWGLVLAKAPIPENFNTGMGVIEKELGFAPTIENLNTMYERLSN